MASRDRLGVLRIYAKIKLGKMRTGRPRKPAEVHKSQGTYQPCRHDEREGGIELSGKPEPPKSLLVKHRKVWDRIVPDLWEAGVLRAIDTDNLAAMCRWWVKWDEEMKENGATTKAKVAWEQFSKLGSKYGLDPISREMIKAPPKEKSGLVAVLKQSRAAS